MNGNKFLKCFSGLLVLLSILNPCLGMEDEPKLDDPSPPPSLNSSVIGDDQSVVIQALKTQIEELGEKNLFLRDQVDQLLLSLAEIRTTLTEEFKREVATEKGKMLQDSKTLLEEKLKELQEGYAKAIKNERPSFQQTIRTDAYFWGIAFCSGTKILYDSWCNYQGFWMLPITLASSTIDNLANIINFYFVAKILAAGRTFQNYLPSQTTKKEKDN